MGMLDDFKATSLDAKPEDLAAVGVSERVAQLTQSEEFRAMQAREQIDNEAIDAMLQSDSRLGAYRLIPLEQLMYSPAEWNQFTPLSDDMKVQMAKSILLTGLQQPIVVREMDETPTGYQILAGNTRTEIYRILRKAFNDQRFASIPAVVYPYGKVDDETAKLIVTDTNYIQRAQLSKKDRAFAIHEKLSYLRTHGDVKALEKVAEELHISKPTTYFWDMVHSLIPELFDLYDDGRLELRAAARLGTFPAEIQQQLFEEKEFLTNSIILQIPAKTKPERVLKKFHEIIEQLTQPKPAEKTTGEWHMRRTKNSIHVTVKGNHDGYEPYVVLLPSSKAKHFVKKYGDYLLKEDTKELSDSDAK